MNGIDLPGSFFLDTNIFFYSFDVTTPKKQKIARDLINSALVTRRGVISTQVVQEFLNVALRKFEKPMGVTEAREYLDKVLMPLCRHFPSLPFYSQSLLVQEETGYAFYDALILTSAMLTRSEILFSEDLQDGQLVGGVKIVNPFR